MLIKRTGCQEFKITLPLYEETKNKIKKGKGKVKERKRTVKRATQKDFIRLKVNII